MEIQHKGWDWNNVSSESFFFAKHAFKVSAVDLSDSGIAYIQSQAMEQKLAVDATVADMTELPYEKESFDCVICFHTIYHTDYEGMRKALDEIYRVLKSEGEAYYLQF